MRTAAHPSPPHPSTTRQRRPYPASNTHSSQHPSPPPHFPPITTHTNTPQQSSPRPSSPVNSPTTGSTTARPASPKPPGGPATAIRRKAAADRADKVANARPSSTRAAGAGGSSSTMLREFARMRWGWGWVGGEGRAWRGGGCGCVDSKRELLHGGLGRYSGSGRDGGMGAMRLQDV